MSEGGREGGGRNLKSVYAAVTVAAATCSAPGAPQPPAPRSRHAASSHAISFRAASGSAGRPGPRMVKRRGAAVGAQKTQKLGRATVRTRESASI